MKAGLSQTTQLKQELKINPRLYQAMDLLYMPLLDLQQHLKQELETNPFLELVEPEEEEEEETEAEPAAEEPKEEEPKDEIDWEEILLEGFDTGGRREEHEEKEYFEPVTAATRDLSDHLVDQIALLDLSPRELALAEEFVGNINDEGYLVCSVQEIVDGINTELARIADESGRDDGGPLPLYSVEEAERMLGRIQDLEPPGVGARDLRECLMLQLRQAGLEQSVPYRLVRVCFHELINHRWSEISKRFAFSQTEV